MPDDAWLGKVPHDSALCRSFMRVGPVWFPCPVCICRFSDGSAGVLRVGGDMPPTHETLVPIPDSRRVVGTDGKALSLTD